MVRFQNVVEVFNIIFLTVRPVDGNYIMVTSYNIRIVQYIRYSIGYNTVTSPIPSGGPVREVHFRKVFLVLQNIIECGLDVLHNRMELGKILALVQQDVELPSVN